MDLGVIWLQSIYRVQATHSNALEKRSLWAEVTQLLILPQLLSLLLFHQKIIGYNTQSFHKTFKQTDPSWAMDSSSDPASVATSVS